MSSDVPPPRAFLSHASEDKATYAEPLARDLRGRGIDAWLDKWEIRPGDSLVERIFEEGLKGTAAVIVVLSEFSVSKPWVRKELDVGVVRSITKASRLIPVRVDDSDVPESLRDLLWIDWQAKGGAAGVAQEIADVLFGLDPRPTIGEAPRYVTAAPMQVPGLTSQDSCILDLFYQAALVGTRRILQGGEVWPGAGALGLSLDALKESVEVLIANGYLYDKGGNMYQNRILVELPPSVFLDLARANGEDVDSFRKKIAGAILNRDIDRVQAIAAETGLSEPMVEAVVSDFETRGFVQIARFLGGSGFNAAVMMPSAPFRRWFRDQQ